MYAVRLNTRSRFSATIRHYGCFTFVSPFAQARRMRPTVSLCANWRARNLASARMGWDGASHRIAPHRTAPHRIAPAASRIANASFASRCPKTRSPPDGHPSRRVLLSPFPAFLFLAINSPTRAKNQNKTKQNKSYE